MNWLFASAKKIPAGSATVARRKEENEKKDL
jgi:hypothetical protein